VKFRKTVISTSVLALCGMLSLSAQARDEVRVPALTAPFGAGIHEQVVIFERLIAKKHPWIRLVAQESPGYVYNVKEMGTNKRREKTTVTWTSTGALWAGDTAAEGFFQKRIPRDTFRWLMTRSSNCIWFVSLDDSIKSIKDFSGKRIGIGRRSQTHWGLFTTKAIEVGNGVMDSKLEYLGNNAAMSALLDGRVDVAVALTTNTADLKVVFPSGPVRKLNASNRDYVNIPISKAAASKVNKDLNAPFVSHVFPPGTVPKQKDTLECMGDYAMLASHRNFPDDLAHGVTTAYLMVGDAAGKYLGGGKLYRRQSMCVVPPGIEPHPAALKACKDFGLEPKILK
tara:strand:+ start:915 stop:1937 length:1023 start_codon:yes stop_codon:yes gene_type:complete